MGRIIWSNHTILLGDPPHIFREQPPRRGQLEHLAGAPSRDRYGRLVACEFWGGELDAELLEALNEDRADDVRHLIADMRARQDPDAFGRAVQLVGRYLTVIDEDVRRDWFREALTRVEDVGLRDCLRIDLAALHSLSGDMSSVQRLLTGLHPETLLPDYVFRYGLLLRRLGRVAEAEAVWVELLDGAAPIATATRGLLWSHIAHARMHLGRFDGAVSALQEARLHVEGRGLLHVLTTQFDLALRRDDLDEANAVLDAMPALDNPSDRSIMRANRAVLNALRGSWSTEAFAEFLEDERADIRALGALGTAGAAAQAADAAALSDALTTAERAHAASPTSSPDVAQVATALAETCEGNGAAPVSCARARRWAARAWVGVDEVRAQNQRDRLPGLGVSLLGPFQLVAPLGRGGGGTVWQGVHHEGFEAAIKVLHDPNPTTRNHLENELRAIAALDHPRIATLLDIGMVDEAEAAADEDLSAGTRWIATELVLGGDLEPVCGALTWDRCFVLLLGILDGLAHAHARDLLHLDLKPANILLRENGEPVLVDFGLARGVGGARPKHLSGTPEYMAPELFRGAWDRVGPETDLYSVGCTARHLVSGAPPYLGTASEVRELHTRGRVPDLDPLVPVPPRLDAWIRTALASDPRDRFPSAASAAQALLNLGAPVSGAPSKPTIFHPARMTTLLLTVDPGPNTELAEPARPGRLPVPIPDVPRFWTRPERPLETRLGSASLGLTAFRRPALVGRERERSMLWSGLTQATRGQRQITVLTGPDGRGRRAVVRWLIERAREVGVGVSITHLHEPAMDAVRAETARYLLITSAAWPEDAPDATEIPLPPLDAAVIRRILDGFLRLAEPLVQTLVDHSDGEPGRALQALSELVNLDRIVASPNGYVLRRGAKAPRA